MSRNEIKKVIEMVSRLQAGNKKAFEEIYAELKAEKFN